jgi:UDP-glucose 4-epimerase
VILDLNDANSILIIGMAGGLAKITANLLLKSHPHLFIIGVDPRRMDSTPNHKNLNYIRMKYTRNNFESLFRENQFDIVLHLGRTSHANANPLGTLAKRLDLNVMGTRRILELCAKYEVRKIIVLSTFHVYGALPDNPVFLQEDSQLRGDFQYPEIRDVVEMDQISTNFMWKNQESLETVILRPCNIIGSSINNAIQQYLVSPFAPYPIDYNPMFQFLHEFDIGQIIIKSIEKIPLGIFNVAPDDFISIQDAKKRINRLGIPMSIFLLQQTAKIIKKSWIDVPDYLLSYIKHSCMIENTALKKALPEFEFRFSTKDALDVLR